MISIIVPVYKTEPYLHQCLGSLLRQTYKDIEILLIDDGSPDRCGAICDEYGAKDKRIRVFHTENNGLSAARNLGLKEAKGEYLGFVDSDDWIDPDYYEILLKRLLETGADISASKILYFSASKEQQDQENREIVYEGKEILIGLANQEISNVVWNKLYRKKVFDGIWFPVGRVYEDTARMHLILAQAQRMAANVATTYHYRQHHETITKTYTAKNLVDCADAYLSQFLYLQDHLTNIYPEKSDKILLRAFQGISRVWRWWHKCGPDKKEYKGKIDEYKQFSRQHFPLFGCCSWPIYFKLTVVFTYSNSRLSFALLYWMNRLFRLLRGSKSI